MFQTPRQLLQPIVEQILPDFHFNNEFSFHTKTFEQMQKSRFCLVPRGWGGWSYRMFEAIAIGCIPVVIGDYTLYPWQQHLIDWTRFAVFIREAEISILLDILSTIPLQEVSYIFVFFFLLFVFLFFVSCFFKFILTSTLLTYFTLISWRKWMQH